MDGQQFYVRRGTVRKLQDSLFGERFNVVGIPGAAARRRCWTGSSDGHIDWEVAWKLLRSDQWIEDIDRVRRAVAGPEGPIRLYGRSGGGLMVHEYLAKHGNRVSRVFTQAAVNRFFDARLGLSSDTFWADLGRVDPTLQLMLLNALGRRPAERSRIVLMLQRQNFFVPAAAISGERAALIRAVSEWNAPVIDRHTTAYQVDAVLRTLTTPTPAVNVRLFELFVPVLQRRGHTGETARVDPDLEVGELFSAPLLRLLNAGAISAPQCASAP